jgi:hypothetical protein
VIRFVGNNLHGTDYSRVDAWVERIVLWLESGLREVYFFSHEPDNLFAPELAQYVHDMFKKRLPNAVLRGPSPVVAPGAQGVLF